eukprot:242028_1
MYNIYSDNGILPIFITGILIIVGIILVRKIILIFIELFLVEILGYEYVVCGVIPPQSTAAEEKVAALERERKLFGSTYQQSTPIKLSGLIPQQPTPIELFGPTQEQPTDKNTRV